MNHLIYMNDLKLYAKHDDDLEGLLSTVKRLSDDIMMQFGLDNCTKVTFRKVLIIKSKNITLDINRKIIELEHNKPINIYKLMKQMV